MYEPFDANEFVDTLVNTSIIAPLEVYNYLSKVIGTKFHEYRENSNLSLRDIYAAEKVSTAVVSDFENGKKLPRVETLIRLLNLVNMPYAEVFNSEILPSNIPNKSSIATRICKIQDCQYPAVKEILLTYGFNRREIEDIIQYMDFLVSKRK